MKRYKINLGIKYKILIGACLLSICVLPRVLLANDFFQTFTVKYGEWYEGDEITLAKYDMIAVMRFRWDAIRSDSWGEIKAINPDVEIFNYQLGRATRNDQDQSDSPYFNSINRWAISRGHSMGSISDNYAEFVLLDANNNYIINPSYVHEILLDIGNSNLRDYWIEATEIDIVNQPWKNDGIFVDVTTIMRTSMSAMPVKYPTDAAWSTAMNSFINVITVSLNAESQQTWCNRTRVGEEFGYDAWITLDATANPPDAVFEEGVFAVEWGRGSAIIKFPDLTKWKRQIDIMSQIHNSKVTLLIHIPVPDGTSGTDNYGKSLNTWDILWYAMGSFQLGKNTVDNNSYFGVRSKETYQTLVWYDELSDIDLGNAVNEYQITNYSGNNIYWREFQEGYVYVNPNTDDVSLITLPQNCKQLTHSNFKNDPATLPIINSISLEGHRAALLLKSDSAGYPTQGIVPTGVIFE